MWKYHDQQNGTQIEMVYADMIARGGGCWRCLGCGGLAGLEHGRSSVIVTCATATAAANITAIAIGHEFSNNTPIIFIYSCFVNLFVALVQSECCVQARMNYRLIKLSSPYSY